MKLRVVLDTNIICSSVLFSAGRLTWLRHAWQQQHLTPLLCRQTAAELLRVLAYPKFKLSPSQQEDLLADVLSHAEHVALPARWPDLPQCRDQNDQVFLVLAQIARADALVTDDQDLRSMQGQFAFPVISVQALADQLLK